MTTSKNTGRMSKAACLMLSVAVLAGVPATGCDKERASSFLAVSGIKSDALARVQVPPSPPPPDKLAANHNETFLLEA